MATATLDDPGRRRLTQADLDDTPDDGNRWEIIDGELHVTPQPTPAHQNVVMQLGAILNAHVRKHALGRVFPAAIRVVLDEPTGVGPDLVFISNARLPGLQADGFYGAPDLVVEVLSSKPALDRLVKRDKYARAGVPHYWLVDPALRTFEVLVLDGDRYGLPLVLAGDARFTPTLFPGLEIDLQELWL